MSEIKEYTLEMQKLFIEFLAQDEDKSNSKLEQKLAKKKR